MLSTQINCWRITVRLVQLEEKSGRRHIARFQQALSDMGYKYQFITLVAFQHVVLTCSTSLMTMLVAKA